MFSRNKHSQAPVNRNTLDEWPKNTETWAEYMARTGSEGLGGQVPFLLACMILGVWVVWLLDQVVMS